MLGLVRYTAIYIVLISYKIECFRLFEVNLSDQTKLAVVKMLTELLLSDEWLLFTGLGIIILLKRYVMRFSVYNTLYIVMA